VFHFFVYFRPYVIDIGANLKYSRGHSCVTKRDVSLCGRVCLHHLLRIYMASGFGGWLCGPLIGDHVKKVSGT
jgi:hypothetical protein